jgi:hypothetical protein
MIQASQATEVLLGDGWGRLGGREAVGIGWVSHNNDLGWMEGASLQTAYLLPLAEFD